MISQLLRFVSPELIEQSFKSNPEASIEILQRFESFKLLGAALTHDQQVAISSNIKYIKHYLVSSDGKDSARIWAEGFVDFVGRSKTEAAQLLKSRQDEEDALAAAKLQVLESIRQKDIDKVNLALKEAENTKTRLALEIRMRAEMETRIRKEIEAKMAKAALTTTE